MKPEIHPVDILIDMVVADEMDPWDIDIADIANKFVEKVNEMERINVLAAGDELCVKGLLLAADNQRVGSEVGRYVQRIHQRLSGRRFRLGLAFDARAPPARQLLSLLEYLAQDPHDRFGIGVAGAFVATVDPWTTSAELPSTTCFMPARTALAGLSGVEGSL